jgi:hypothetical protein
MHDMRWYGRRPFGRSIRGDEIKAHNPTLFHGRALPICAVHKRLRAIAHTAVKCAVAPCTSVAAVLRHVWHAISGTEEDFVVRKINERLSHQPVKLIFQV